MTYRGWYRKSMTFWRFDARWTIRANIDPRGLRWWVYDGEGACFEDHGSLDAAIDYAEGMMEARR